MKFIRTALLTAAALAMASPAVALSVVASTSWTAAFAYTAGADEVTVLAPYDVTHPPEYVLRPSDIVTLSEADVVIYAGYETMVERMLDAVSSGAVVVQIATVHSYPVIQASVLAVARALGTEAEARRNLAALRTFLDEWKSEMRAALPPNAATAVHFHQQALAAELGLQIAAVFGPAPLEARQIEEISRNNPKLVIDNEHNRIAGPLAETTDALIVSWRNFPAADGTLTLLDILTVNRETTRAALATRADVR